jgi:hypothetical protein
MQFRVPPCEYPNILKAGGLFQTDFPGAGWLFGLFPVKELGEFVIHGKIKGLPA